MALFDETPFPFSDPRAQRLLDLLKDAYRDAPSIGMLLDLVGIPRPDVDFGQAPTLIWHDALAAAANRGTVTTLIRAVLTDRSRAAFHGRLRMVLASAGQPDPGEPISVGTIPREPPGFLDRGTVRDIEQVLESDQPAVVCVLIGGRGLGKTQLAAACARRRIAGGWSLVGWVNADTAHRLITDLADIADALGLGDPNRDSTRSAELLTRHLANRREPGLIVFDNATDPDLAATYLPASGATRVVITSTERGFTELGDPVHAGTYTRAESIDYLRRRTGLDHDDGADRVATELGDHPLALAQAAGTIATQGWNYEIYLDQLATTPIDELLQRLPGQQYPHGTARAMLLAIEQLEATDTSGAIGRVLRIVAVLSPDGVPRVVLRPLAGILAITPPRLESMLGRCAAGSVTTSSRSGDEILLHRLLSRVLRERDQLAGTFDSTLRDAAELLGDQIRTCEATWRERESLAGLIAQIESLWVQVDLRSTDQALTEGALNQRAWALYRLNRAADYVRSVMLGVAVVADVERILGPDHPDTLSSRDNLAIGYRKAGRPADAIHLHERTLADRERTLGADHPDTLTSRNNLALAYQSAGRRSDAIHLHERTLADRERILGPDHSETLRSRNNLATAYQEASRPADAIRLHEKAFTDRNRLLGPDHPDTLGSRNNLAIAYQEAGRTAYAISLHEQTLTDRERILGPDHPDTLTSRNNLATTYVDAGRLADAIRLHEQNVADRERALGPDHPDTIKSRSNLAVARTRLAAQTRPDPGSATD